MIRTPLCDLLGIDHPLIQGALGPWNSVALAAAVSNAGALGSLATTFTTADRITADIADLRRLTDRPFAVNLTMRPFDRDVYAAVLAAGPPVVSLALGPPGTLVEQAHAVGALFVQQVHGREQALAAAQAGADAVVAQGGEAGGFGGGPGTFTLVPELVDAVAPLPVVAAGGIVDGRGLAAALALGAVGAQLGTRFLASAEAAAPEDFQRAVLEAGLDATERARLPEDALPRDDGGFATRPRLLRTAALSQWEERLVRDPAAAGEFQAEVVGRIHEGRGHELLPLAGESAGRIRDVVPAAELVRRIIAEAGERLRDAGDRVA